MDHLRHITRDAEICGGDYIIRDTRITLRTVLADLAAGTGYADMHGSYPAITLDVFQSIIAFAAAAAEDTQPVLPKADDLRCKHCLPFDYFSHFDKPDDHANVVIRGTDISVRSLLDRLAAGDLEDAILHNHHGVTHENLRAVIAFAADSAEDDMPRTGLPAQFGGAMAILEKLDADAPISAPR